MLDMQPHPKRASNIPEAPTYRFDSPQVQPPSVWYKDRRLKVVIKWACLTVASGLLGLPIFLVLGILSFLAFFGTISPSYVSNQLPVGLLIMFVSGITAGLSLGIAQKIGFSKFSEGIETRLWIRLSALAGGVGMVAYLIAIYEFHGSGLIYTLYDGYYGLPAPLLGTIPTGGGSSLLSEIAVFVTILLLSLPGFLVGAVQWLILRRYVKNAWLWVLTNMVSWCIGGMVIFLIVLVWPANTNSGWDSFLHILVVYFACLFVLGIVNSYALVFVAAIPLRGLRQ